MNSKSNLIVEAEIQAAILGCWDTEKSCTERGEKEIRSVFLFSSYT